MLPVEMVALSMRKATGDRRGAAGAMMEEGGRSVDVRECPADSHRGYGRCMEKMGSGMEMEPVKMTPAVGLVWRCLGKVEVG